MGSTAIDTVVKFVTDLISAGGNALKAVLGAVASVAGKVAAEAEEAEKAA